MSDAKYLCYRLAAGLNRKEWNRFVRECRKGVRGQHEETRGFILALAGEYPEFNVDESQIVAKSFPGRDFTDARLRVLRNYLKSELEQYYVQLALEEDERQRMVLLLKGLGKNGNHQLAKIYLDKQVSKLKQPLMDVDDMALDFQLQELALDIHVRSGKRQDVFAWGQILEKLETYSQTHTLRLLAAMLNNPHAGEQILADSQLEPQELLDRTLNVANPLTKMYRLLFKLLSGLGAEGDEQCLEKELEVQAGQMDRIERLNILGLLSNYLMKRHRRGNIESGRRLLWVFQEMLQQSMILNAGRFSLSFARNLVVLAARFGEETWVQRFLKKDLDNFTESEQEKLRNFGQAYLEFARGNYAEARRRLALADDADPFYRHALDFLLLMICYESGEGETFEVHHARLSRKFTRNTAGEADLNQALRNTLRITRMMFVLRWEGRGTLAKLNELISASEWILAPEWLFPQVEKLEQGLQA